MKTHFGVSPDNGPYTTYGMFHDEITEKGLHHVVLARTRSEVRPDNLPDELGLVAIGSMRFPKSLGILYKSLGIVGPVVLVEADEDNCVTIHVAATSARTAKEMADKIVEALPRVPEKEKDTVQVRFWYWHSTGPDSNFRELAVPAWDTISRNYSQNARDSLTALMTLDKAHIEGGKLVLFHGAVGTGKTTAVRALADAWRSWCHVEYVVDPEALFGQAAYLVNLLLDNWAESSGKWRLLIIEDAGEFLKPEAKQEVHSQSLARLLNLSDGLIGQGLKTLMLITTNEPLSTLHPAIKRPGRCLAHIEVPALTAREATAWSGMSQSEPKTLAELFELKAKEQIVNNGMSDNTVHGIYL